MKTIVLALLAAFAAAAAGATPVELVEGSAIRDRIGGSTRTFTLHVPSESAVRVTVVRQGIYVVLHLRAGAEEVVSVDDNNGPNGTLVLAAPVRSFAATYELDVQPVARDGCGSFDLYVERGPADETSRRIAEAQERFFQARRVENAGDADSVRRALDMLDEAFEESLRAGDLSTAAAALYRSSITNGLLGRHAESSARLERVLPLFQELGLRAAEARAIGRLGENARRVGDVESAERFFGESLTVAHQAADLEGECDTLNNLGLLLSQTGRWDEAITMLQGAVPIADRTATFQVRSALQHNIGETYGAMGDYVRSLEAYGRALAIKKQFHDTPRRTGRTLLSMGTTYVGAGDLDKAWTALDEAGRLFDVSGDPQGIGTTALVKSRVLLERDNVDAAAESATKALRFLSEAGDRRGEAYARIVLGEIDVRGGRIDAAVERLSRAVDLAQEAVTPRTEAAALYWLGRAKMASGRLDDAIVYARRAVDVVESMRQGISDPELRATYLATLRRYFDLLIDLLMLQHQRAPEGGFAAEAFRVNERSRARTLLESLARANTEVTKGVAPELLAREQSLRRQLRARELYRAQLLRGDRTRPELADVERVIADLGARHRAAETEIRTTSPDYAALAFPEPPTLQEVQTRLLASDTVLLEYHLGAEHSYVWVVLSDAVHVHVLPDEKTIDALARAEHDLLRRNPTAVDEAKARDLRRRVAKAGTDLARAVLAPVLGELQGKRLLVVADGALHYVPFAALADENGTPLINRYEIAYLPSASLLGAGHEPSSADEPRAIAVFADPVFQRNDPRFPAMKQSDTASTRTRGTDFRRLQFSRREAEAIGEAAQGKQRLQALDFEASKRTLIGTDLRGYDIIHFATHGVVDSEEPERSGLLLSLYDRQGKKIDGFVRLDEVYNLDLHAKLVVLSACRTALGKVVYGEGLVGLTRGFMYGGARRVAATLWSIDDRASAQMMAHFYDAMLRRALDPAAALRSAQLAMRSDPRWRDPYFWAAFTLHGD